jgi:anhydro-N-acetylmuramic acid kinase
MSDSKPGERYVGLISGTSMDGIDAVVVDFGGASPRLLSATTLPFEGELRETLDAVRLDPDHFPVARLGWLDAVLGDRFAEAARAVIVQAGLDASDITAIGSHGQTVVHHAEADPPYTLQIADPHRISENTGIVTVADFRRADLAAGGQGAPLAPLLHDALFRSDDQVRAVVNLGGIANVTLLAPGEPVRGFDTGPANCFLDLWYRRHFDSARYDAGGRWAASGSVDPDWLARLMDDPFLARPAPKSTGIEYFTPAWLDERLPGWAASRPADIQATLSEFSALSLAEAIEAAQGEAPSMLVACGGGAANADLLGRIERRCNGTRVVPSDELGLDADHVEATLFAWLARARLADRRLETGPVTGAGHPVALGTIHLPPTT